MVAFEELVPVQEVEDSEEEHASGEDDGLGHGADDPATFVTNSLQ